MATSTTADAQEHDLGVEVVFGAVGDFMGGGGFLQVGDGAAHADAELLAHAEQGEAGAHQHAADGDGAHDGEPHVVRQGGPVHGRARGQIGLDARSEEVNEQWNQQAPGDHAAGEIQRGKARPDDVADAEIGGADGGRVEGGHAAGGDHGCGGGAADAQAAGHGRNPDQDGAHVPEDVDLAQEVHHRAEAHVGEEDLGGLGALLSGLVNFRGGDGFGEGELGVLDHDAAQQGDEKNAEQCRRSP